MITQKEWTELFKLLKMESPEKQREFIGQFYEQCNAHSEGYALLMSGKPIVGKGVRWPVSFCPKEEEA